MPNADTSEEWPVRVAPILETNKTPSTPDSRQPIKLSTTSRGGNGLKLRLVRWVLMVFAGLLQVVPCLLVSAEENLLSNPGFEEAAGADGNPPGWVSRGEGGEHATVSDQEPHQDRACVAIPAHTSIAQRVDHCKAGAYLARGWIKSGAEQAVTILVQDPDRPWSGYTCAEIKAPKDRWVQFEAFCALDQAGPLTLTLGGMSPEFRNYHGAGAELASSILVDDCELVRYQPGATPPLSVWDAGKDLGAALESLAAGQWSRVEDSAHTFQGTPVFQDRQVAGMVRKNDGTLALYSVGDQRLIPRGVIAPSPALGDSQCTLIRTNGRTGIRVAATRGDRAYTAWLAPNGVIDVEPHQVPRFRVEECKLAYGLLPSFVGTDICYAPQKLPDLTEVQIPSTQWFVGLGSGSDNMLVAVWGAEAQAASLGLTGQGTNRAIDSLSIATDSSGFSLSFVQHPNLWHLQALNEDWLGEYVPIGWERPFPARWMGHFFVTPGGRPTFREPNMAYSFPIADVKTRLWGVWFEDWNHFPFFFEGPGTVLHFEKSFVPNGDALIYFLEPAAADLFSPCEIVEQVLGAERAAALFDFDANRIRQLKYSTPHEFMYDRPVCATTARLSNVRKDEKATVGINLVTHLYEFIREIRGRVDEYRAFFEDLKAYLAAEAKAHPESRPFITPLETLVTEAQSKAAVIYATPLSAVQTKTESMKKLLLEGKGDGFDCGSLDVRSPAGAQDDLCRRYNRLVLKLTQTAALNCGNSAENAAIAKHVWDQSRKILRQPTRWEPRRSLYFFEP
jgi:hypothetical protein